MYCTTMFMHTDEFVEQKIENKKCFKRPTPPDTHQKTFVIQKQPAVIDWSICLCVAYKWATWYSALFIWNQLRQRCCVSACGTRALFLSCSLIFCLCEWESNQDKTRIRWREKGDAGSRGLCLCNSLFNCMFLMGVSTTRACVQWIQMPVHSAVRHTNWVQSTTVFTALLFIALQISICPSPNLSLHHYPHTWRKKLNKMHLLQYIIFSHASCNPDCRPFYKG